MAAGAPAGSIRAIDEENKRQRELEQNKEIRKYMYTCSKCESDSFSKYYYLATEELDEHLRCQCAVCGYIWRMYPRDKENGDV